MTMGIVANVAGVLAAILGLAFFLYRRCRIEAAFSFLGAIAIITVGLYLFGVFGLLAPAFWVLYVGGIGLFGCMLYEMIRHKDWGILAEPGLYVFLGSCALFCFFFYNVYCYIPDEYSHWMVAAREILYFGHLPDARTVITYKNYPPATAVWLYFCMKLTGYSDGMAHVYQNFLVAGSVAALFAGASFKKPAGVAARVLVAFVVSTVCALTYATLLVDNVLGLVAMALLVMTIFYYAKPEQLTGARWLLLAAVGSLVVLIKTSGTLFAAVAIAIGLLLLLLGRRATKEAGLLRKKGRVAVWLTCTLLPLLAAVSWRVYTRFAYGAGSYGTNKFAITPDNLARGYHSKTPEFLAEMPAEFIRVLFSSKQTHFYLVALAIAVAAGVYIYVHTRKVDRVLVVSVPLSLGLWAVYNIGYYYMLRYLMPVHEMINDGHPVITNFSRYESSLLVPLVGLMLMAALLRCEAAKLPKRHWKQWVAVVVCAAVFWGLNPRLFSFGKLEVPRTSEQYQQFEQINLVYNQVPPVYNHDTRMVFYTGHYNDNDPGTVYNNHAFQGIYLLRSSTNFSNTSVNGTSFTDVRQSELLALLCSNEYLVCQIQDPELFRMMEALGVEYDAADGILYRIVPVGAESCRLEKIA